MAKQFCDQSEAARILGVSEDEVRAMARDGKLRVFNDAKGPQYRVDDLNRMASGKEGSSIIDLAVGDAEPRADIGLSGSDVIALETSDEEKKPGKEDTKITSVGISVFDDEELEIDADPMAKTHVSAAMDDQVNIGSGSGSGSGLLDLTRESDDTSLGAELLDVISPTEAADTETQARPMEEAAETITAPVSSAAATDEFAMDAGAPVMAAPRMGPSDPIAPMFTGLIVACIVMLSLVGFVAAAAMQGVWPEFMSTIALGTGLYMYVVGGGFVLALLAAAIGFFIGRSGGGRPARRMVTR